MSYVIVDDNGVFQVRAAIDKVAELDEMIEKLQQTRQKLVEREKEESHE